mmetsp:Transcript_106215/g.331340  ORF Transcript_106215/g.331340 Transcript_106215/m.331340 type:complete len:201 (+) Transcript_106215:1819-2421(+)
MPICVRCPPGRPPPIWIVSFIVEMTASNMPVTTAVYETSMTNMKTGGCGGLTMYSPGAMYSTAPLQSSALSNLSTLLPAVSRLAKYESWVICENPQMLQLQRRPLDSQCTKGLMYVRHDRHLTIVPTEAWFTACTPSMSCGNGANGWMTMPRGMFARCLPLAELGGRDKVPRTKCGGELNCSSSLCTAAEWASCPGCCNC